MKEVKAWIADVGAAVRRVREARGLTQVQLARRAGVHRRTLLAIEGGAGGTLDSLGRLCFALDYTPERLCLPRGLLGSVTRAVCARFGLDLLTGRPQRQKPRRLSLAEEITGRPGPPRRKR